MGWDERKGAMAGEGSARIAAASRAPDSGGQGATGALEGAVVRTVRSELGRSVYHSGRQCAAVRDLWEAAGIGGHQYAHPDRC